MGMDFTFTVSKNLPAPMRDGTVLRADIYTPNGPGPFPVLLCQTPYGKHQDTYTNTAGSLARMGYIAVVQDIRGTYQSGGDFWVLNLDNAKSHAAEDGYDTTLWAAGLKGSDGQVGTWGHSYPSWCIWRTAPTNPPPVKAIFAGGMAARALDVTFGIFETGRRLQWFSYMAADQRQRAGVPHGPHTREEANTNWIETDRFKWIWRVPLNSIPDYVFSTLTPQLKQFYGEQAVESWAFDKIHHEVRVPTLQVTGWYDRLIGTIDNFTGMVQNGPAENKDKHHLIIGPWGHSNNDYRRQQGPLDFGPEADVDYSQMIARWYDHHYKGVDNGYADEAPVKLFLMGANHWRHEREWPLARTQYSDFFLHSGGSANTPRGNGVLSPQAPGQEPPDHYDYDPQDPLMSQMGLDAQAAPRSQAPLDGRTDNLVYQTEPLEQELEVTGPVELILWASSNAPDTDFAAKLIDVHPDGLAVNLSYAILRARYRDGYDSPRLLEPGKPYELRLKLNPTGILFKKGHRIRLDIASSDFPNFDRNHNTGKDFWSDTEFRIAHQTIFHDSDKPSRLILPVIPAGQ